jgi:predicted regulator of Ras-like GTPase activity (Roadblock/LC7/MglB family)
MDAAQALADLTEISSQIEGAVLAAVDGKVLASSFSDATKSEAVARAAGELLRAAHETRPRSDVAELAHLQVATPEGSVFLVRDDERFIAAVTGPDPTVGLVFYDLKTCLRLAAEEANPGDKKPRRRAKKTENDGATEAAEKGARTAGA